MSVKIMRLFAILFVLQILTACTTTAPVPPTPTPEPPTATLPPPTETSLPTATQTATLPPPTDTPTLEPTSTPTLANTNTPAPTATFTPPAVPTIRFIPLPAASRDTVNIYFIQMIPGSGSCNDRVLAVGSGVKISGDIEDDVKAGLTKLFSYKDKYYGELYNPLYASRIRVQKVDFNRSGLIEVWMSGSYQASGDPCDNTRVKAQIWNTIKQFRGVETTNIFMNDIPFGDRLSNDK